MRPTPQYDTIRCKHCEAIIALVPRAAVKNKFGCACLYCGVITIIWPLQRQAEPVYTVSQEVPA
jgi:hypothetical protein